MIWGCHGNAGVFTWSVVVHRVVKVVWTSSGHGFTSLALVCMFTLSMLPIHVRSLSSVFYTFDFRCRFYGLLCSFVSFFSYDQQNQSHGFHYIVVVVYSSPPFFSCHQA